MRAAGKKVGITDDRIALVGDKTDPDVRVKHFSSVLNLAGTSRYRKTKVVPEKDLSFLVYSSGTTGKPKGVMLSHRNIVANVLQVGSLEGENVSWDYGKDKEGDRILAFLPFFHIYGMFIASCCGDEVIANDVLGLTCLIHQSMFLGLHLVVMSRFEIERWCAHVQNFRITFSYVVPPVVLLLSKHPIVDKYDLSSLRLLNSGAAPITRELLEATYARIKTGIKQGYGLSETSPTTHTQPWSDWNKTIGSVGKMVANMEAKYMTTPEDDSEPQEVPIGEVGELYMRGPNIFLGYHNNPTATAASISPGGWFRTGDVGYQDPNGNFYITDRVKELIKYKGFQVAPAELEGILADNDAINDVAVIGVESKEHGTEVPRAYVVRRGDKGGNDEKGEAEAIVKFLDEKVAHHKRLRGGVRFVDEIPKSVSGKILRRVLKEKARKEEEEGVIKAKL